MIKGKTALVTGSTSGIGKAIADRLAQEGCNVVLNGFGDADEIKALQAEMGKEHGVQIGYSGADLTNPDAIEEMMAYVTTDFGGTDILVNNAGTQFVSPLEEFPVAKWDLIMALNLSAAFHTTRMAIGPMVASPFKSAYVAAKHGLSGLTKVTALEGAEHGVRCNLVCPGYVHTPLVDGQIDDTAKARGMTRDEVVKNVLLAAQPTKEFVTAEQIGGFVAFLCSPDADQINGADLSMDGGWVAQ